MDDKVVLHKYYLPVTNTICSIEYREDTECFWKGEWEPEPDSDDNDLVRLYPFPPKDEKGEYNPPICLHDGVSEIRYASGRVVKILVKGCNTKDKDDKSPCTTILEDTHAGESG